MPRTLAALRDWFVLACVSLALGAALTHLFFRGSHPALELEVRSQVPSTMQVFFDVGRGIQEQDSAAAFVPGTAQWVPVRFEFRPGELRQIRLDPSAGDNSVSIRALRIVGADKKVVADLSGLAPRPLNQVAEVRGTGDEVTILPISGANDPYVGFSITPIAIAAESGIRVLLIAAISLLVAVAFWSGSFAVRALASRASARWLLAHPAAIIALASVCAAVLSSAPIVLAGKSYLSPNNGVLLAYDSLPTLPGYTDAKAEAVHGADVGAAAWQHFAYTLIQERAVRAGELPLWNRYNGGGRTLIGQGQSMIGDPLNWLVWGLGTSAGAYDVKYVTLRFVFAASIGLCVLFLGGSLGASVVTAFASAFATYFLYRLSHPAVFSLCYAAPLLLAWLGACRATDRRVHWWTVAIVLANWLLLNSGTGKEAYVLAATVNATGMLFVVIWLHDLRRKRIRLAVTALALFCSVLITAPLWGTFLQTIASGSTSYQVPLVAQFAPADLLGFSDNVFFLFRDNRYWPGLNMLLFLGMLAGIALLMDNAIAPAFKRAAGVLAAMVGACLAVAFGVVPAWLLVAVPYLNSIHHVNNTFSTAAIVPAAVLCGLGLTHLANANRSQLRAVATMAALVVAVLAGLYMGPAQFPHAAALGYLALTAIAFCVLVHILRTRGVWATSAAGLAVLSTVMLVLLGRGAAWGDTSADVDRYLFNPKDRVDLLAESEVTKFVRAHLAEPTRVVSVGNSVFSGYRAIVGLESIDGPDALETRHYRELTEALNLPYGWYWRVEFSRDSLHKFTDTLDFLGVGIVFSRAALDGDGLTEIASEPRLRAYRRPGAWPRAFFANSVRAATQVSDVADLLKERAAPFVAISAADIARNEPLQRLVGSRDGQATVSPAFAYRLTNNATSFKVRASGPGIAYLAENDDPGNFEARVNGRSVPYFRANHAFKAVYLPEAGEYEIEFRYWPKRFNLLLAVAAIGVVLLAALFTLLRRLSERAVPLNVVENLMRVPVIGHQLGYVRAHFWQIVRFGLVGVSIAGLNVTTFYLFREIVGLNDSLAVTGMYLTAVLVHFYGHRHVTFQAQAESVRPQGGKYAVMLGLNFLIYQTIVGMAPLAGISPYLGVVVSGAATVVSNFLLMKHFIFAKRGLT